MDPKLHYQGQPCKHGHCGVRFKSSRNCIECTKQNHLKWKRENSEREKNLKKDWIAKHPDYYKLRWKANPERGRAASKRWRENHPHINRAKTARRRATQLKVTPCWVNQEDLKQVYEQCPLGYEVDHVIPLQNSLVCGLHVPWNLDYLTPEQNRSKGNTFEGIECGLL